TSGIYAPQLGSAGRQVQLASGTSGFSAAGGPLTVDVNGNGTGTGGTLAWGVTPFFNPGQLVLNAISANDTLTLLNNVDLGSSTRQIHNDAPNTTAIMPGVISGTGGVTKSGGGLLQLTGNNTFTGGDNVNAGTLLVDNDGNLGNSTTIAFGGGVLRFNSAFGGSFTRTIALNAGGGGFDTNGFNI